MPIDYNTYPPDWSKIRQRILQRAGNRCEWPGCGAPNGWCAFWSPAGTRHVVPLRRHPGPGTQVSLIVLTVAHKDHDVNNNADNNLAAWCQYHHLAWNRDLHRQHARETRRRQRQENGLGGQLSLW
jgi:hypothetical protein